MSAGIGAGGRSRRVYQFGECESIPGAEAYRGQDGRASAKEFNFCALIETALLIAAN